MQHLFSGRIVYSHRDAQHRLDAGNGVAWLETQPARFAPSISGDSCAVP